MEVIDNNQYTYDYISGEPGIETLKIIKPNHTKLIFHHSADGVDIRLMSKNPKPSLFSFDSNSFIFNSMKQVLGPNNNAYFLDTVLEDKLLLVSKRDKKIVLTMFSTSTDEENQYFMTLNRNAFTPVFTAFQEKQRQQQAKVVKTKTKRFLDS